MEIDKGDWLVEYLNSDRVGIEVPVQIELELKLAVESNTSIQKELE